MPDISQQGWQQIVRRLQMQPRKTVVLAVLVAMMIGLWTRALTRQRPASARAVPTDAPRSPVMASPAAKAEPSRALASLQKLLESPVPSLRRNLFLLDLNHFAKEGQTSSSPAGLTSGFWAELEKSLAAKADHEKARRILAGNLQAQAAKLELQSTVMGNGSPKAMINGMLVGPGDSVEGFRIVKIESRRVIVEREGIKLEVLFKF